ncbi:MAG: DUF2306 domain-containing protein [Xanthomonadaceae bacterium]|nr:DUF2306 domain-containing protein [Xanthomonadaceae bacterium]
MSSRISMAMGRVVGTLFVLSLVCSLAVWQRIVLPVLGGDLRGHETHAGLLYAHAASGTLMLLFGAAALYVGWTRRFFSLHKWIGGTYLAAGSIVSLLALILPLVGHHEPASIAVATSVIATVWLLFSAMAWRAARNRRFDAHQGWMIRSYVVTWTFVFCRMAMQFSLFPSLGAEAITATIWVSFIIPVVACEIVMQWPNTAPLAR